MNRYDELTRQDLVSDTENKVKKRSNFVGAPKYIGITKDYTVKLHVRSATKYTHSYVVSINLTEYADIADDEDMTVKDKVLLSLAGDLKIGCECPAFLYWGYKYITTELDVNAIDPESRFPKIRNPKLDGVMCKHCYKAITKFGSLWSSIAKDILHENFVED